MNQPVPINLPHAPVPRTGQATEIEKSRAGAEVFYSVLAAKQSPRDEDTAMEAMRRACRSPRLAERAFFRYTRSGSQITGPSVHLARELARCWGNIQYGVAELRRDDVGGESEMQAFAWDLETNSRNAQVFIVPHRRDSSRGPKQLVEQRDIYENNANNGARRVREAIFAVLPVWFVEEAQELCQRTLADGEGKPLGKRVADAVAGFGGIGVTEAQLAAKVGRPRDDWTPDDLAQLSVIYRSIKRGEMNRDEEFPPTDTQVTAEEITTGKAKGDRFYREPPAEPAADTGELRLDDPDLQPAGETTKGAKTSAKGSR